ncbi:polysulfide reductase NrfD [Trichlorobacter lovleyi]|uniref:NrfD/PsrC family molybdoenzyme membrane anchor subunit n=1 Tax=Trichlorobacter lovleyi TaxID=313985 RepID=UPI00223E8F0A|nr:NrfD/PsrC family molybdoenzyme membrane anchor subunit [Trichlorobacter lovleyi]QOX80320.1 polysulfide reductase NrfD [Trichlorobacter lovleyi]
MAHHHTTPSLNELVTGVANRLKTAGTGFYLMVFIAAAVVLASAGTGLMAMIKGHEAYYNVYREVPWGVLIATYVFFVVSSTGLCLISSIGHVFGVQDFMPIAKRSVFLSIATILSGFFVIAFEIKLPWRMAIWNVISPNLTSNIWWMGTLYGIYLAFMFAEYIFLLMNKHRPAVICGFSGSVAGIAAHSNLGAVFGLLMGRPYWQGPYMPIYFIASAMMTGCAVILMFHILGYKINKQEMAPDMQRALEVTTKIGILLICVILFFTTWKLIAGAAGQPNGAFPVVQSEVVGHHAFVFWFFEILLGMAGPLVLFILSKGRNLKLMLIASLSMVIGIFVMRFNLVYLGQSLPVYYDLGVNEFKEMLHYSPSVYEWIITAGGFGLTALLFLIGEKVFDGHKVEDH